MRLALSEMLGPRLSLAGAALMGGQQSLGRWADGAYFAYDATRDKGFLNYGRSLRPLTGIPGISITRATSAYYTDAQGNLTLFPSGAARIGNRGLLIEGAATNLCLQSADFSTTWARFRVNAFGSGSVANAVAAPDGTTTADFICEDTTASNTHDIRQNIGKAAASITYTATLYAKAATRSWLRIIVADSSGSTNGAYSHFNVGSGAVGTTGTLGTGWTFVSARITAAANGWYRCELTVTSDASTGLHFNISLATGDLGTGYSGDGSSGLYLWGAQLEATAYATSYIPTTTGSATRNADVISVGSITGLTYANGVTLFAEFERAADTGATEMILAVDDGDLTDYCSLVVDGSDRAASVMITGSVSQGTSNVTGALGVGTVHRAASRFGTNTTRAAASGTLGPEDTSATTPATPTTIRIGRYSSGANPAYAYLRRLAIYPTAYTDAQLQSLTA